MTARLDCPKSSGRFRPVFEVLEDRCLLACEVFVDDKRTLFVVGDETDNRIGIVGRSDNVIVTCDRVITRVPAGNIDDIQVKGGKGNDTLSAAAIAAALHMFGDDGDDSLNYDVNEDGLVKPSDVLGGGGHNTFTVNTTVLADLVKIIGTGNRVIPDPEISVTNAVGAELAHLFVQEFDGITVNTRGGNDRVEMLNNQGLLADIGWTINTGDGADDVHFVAVPDPNNPAGCPAAPERLTVNLGSTPGPDDNMQGFLAEDHFVLDAAAGWCPSDPTIPARIDVLGGHGSQHVSLNFGAIGSPPLGQGFSEGAELFMDLGAAGDLAEMLYAGNIFIPVSLVALMGIGNDKFTASFLPDSGVGQAGGGAFFRGAVQGGPGDDTFMMNVGDPNSPPAEPENLPHIGYDLDASFDGGAGSDAFLIGMLNVAIDGPVDVKMVGGPGFDQMNSQYRGASFGSSLDVTQIGGGGGDLFTNDYSLVEWRGPVTIDQHGSEGADSFTQKLQDVQIGCAICGPDAARFTLDGGGGADAILIGLLRVAGPDLSPQVEGVAAVREAALDIDVMTGDGRDQVTAMMQDIGVDLHLDATLGGGEDVFTATIMPDTGVGSGGGRIEANVNGGGGRDTFTLNVGNDKVDPNNPNAPLAAELDVRFGGGAGGDSFLIGLLNVAIDGPVTIVEVGGEGNDSFLDTFSQVAAGGGAWNIAHQGGAGNDSLHSSFFDFFADLAYGADLGSGNDTAVIAIIRKAAAAGLSSNAVQSELVPAVRVEVAAGAGNDDVTLAIDRALEEFSAFLDGGMGRDIARVTENVKSKGQLVNFEKVEVIP